METMTHHLRVEIAAKKRNPFRPYRGLAALDLFWDTMLNRRIWEGCPRQHKWERIPNMSLEG
jgi:hypothetical protein